ncbi:flippase [Patescibacteria group bacterium]|nr:flippase [Patescibacteria group bacterium]
MTHQPISPFAHQPIGSSAPLPLAFPQKTCQNAVMSLTRALAQNTGVQIIGKTISTFIGVAVVALMTRQLGQEGFGMYSTANAYFQFFALFLDFGLNVMVVQMLGEHAGNRQEEDRISSAAFTLRVISALVLLTVAPVLGLFLPYPWELKLAFFAIWGSFFTASLNQIAIGVQQRHMRMHMVAGSEIFGRLVLLAGILVARALNWGLIPIVLIVSLAGLANFLLNFFSARKCASFRWNANWNVWKTLLRRSWPIGVSIVFNLVYFKADTFVLSLVRPQTEVGIYGAAYRVLEILITLPFMYAGVLLPLIAKARTEKNTERFSSFISNAYNTMMLFAAPMVAGVLVLATQGMTLVAGESFAASGNILRILVLAVALIFFGTISSHAVIALDAQKKMLPVYITVAIFTLAGYLAFIPKYGMLAAAWLTVFSELCVAVGATALTLKLSGARWRPSASIKAVLSAFAMATVIFPLRNAPIAIPIIVGMIVYAALIFATGAVSKATIRDVLGKPAVGGNGSTHPLD